MIIIFARHTDDPNTMTELVADENWDIVKHLACERWKVQELFDHHRVWEKLGNNRIVLVDHVLYCRYDMDHHGEQFRLFHGNVTHVNIEEEGGLDYATGPATQ